MFSFSSPIYQIKKKDTFEPEITDRTSSYQDAVEWYGMEYIKTIREFIVRVDPVGEG